MTTRQQSDLGCQPTRLTSSGSCQNPLVDMNNSSAAPAESSKGRQLANIYSNIHVSEQRPLQNEEAVGAERPFVSYNGVTNIVQRAPIDWTDHKTASQQHLLDGRVSTAKLELDLQSAEPGVSDDVLWASSGPQAPRPENHVVPKHPIISPGIRPTPSRRETTEDHTTLGLQQEVYPQIHDSQGVHTHGTSTKHKLSPTTHPHGHPESCWFNMRPGFTHREPFDLDFNKVYFGKVIHIDRIEGQNWTDRPTIVTGVNMTSRRVRVFTVYSFTEAGGLENRYNSLYYKSQAQREHDMRNFILISNQTSVTRAHLGTPVVRLQGGQMAKSCWVNTAEVRELSFDRVCAESVGHALNEVRLPLDQMKILKTHVRYQGNSLFPSEEAGRLKQYDGSWDGFKDYQKEGSGRIRN